MHLLRLRVKISRRHIPVLPLALDPCAASLSSHRPRWKSVHVQHRLHDVIARRHILQAARRIAPRARIHHRGLARASIPSTVTPNTICVRGVSLIWFRGSSLGSVESNSNTRPSSAFPDAAAGNRTATVCAPADAHIPATKPTSNLRIREYKTTPSPLLLPSPRTLPFFLAFPTEICFLWLPRSTVAVVYFESRHPERS